MQLIHQIPEWNKHIEEIPTLYSSGPVIHETATINNSKMGNWVEIGPYAEIIESVIGDYSYVAGVHTSITYADIGKFCSIASSVRINPVNHPMQRVTQHHCTYRRKQYGFDIHDDDNLFAWRKAHRIRIGHDVWIGHGVIIMPGVNIGTGAVIGSGAVVTKDIAPYTIAVGVPAKPIKTRFCEETIHRILASKWWNWSHEELQSRFLWFLDPAYFLNNLEKLQNLHEEAAIDQPSISTGC